MRLILANCFPAIYVIFVLLDLMKFLLQPLCVFKETLTLQITHRLIQLGIGNEVNNVLLKSLQQLQENLC